MLQRQVKSLLSAVEGFDALLILVHNDPDPDAIASAVALRHLLREKLALKAHIVYKGIVGRAENKALVRYLGHPLRMLAKAELAPSIPVALVDTQPGAGNNALPPTYDVVIVFDHHPLREGTSRVPFADVRPYVGATSTILTEYLQAAEIEPPRDIATALFYGIKTDTMALGRGASQADVSAYFYLQSRIDVGALARIERAQVPTEYFKGLVASLQSAHVYGNVIISCIEEMQRPDLPAEIADLLLRLKGIEWVICMGVYEDEMMLSVRTNHERGAGRLIQEVVGDLGSAGGHGAMAGGQVPLEGRDPTSLASQLRRRILEHLDIAPEVEGEKLI